MGIRGTRKPHKGAFQPLKRLFGFCCFMLCSQMQMREKQQQNRSKCNDRGIIEPRLLLGGFLVILIMGPLVSIGIELQSGFSSMPGFTEIGAAVLAGMFVLAIVLMILGIE